MLGKRLVVVDADEPPVLLGENQAPNTAEYVLHALAACLGGTMVYHAAARGIVLDALECTIEGDVDLAGFLGLDETVRPGFQQIRVAFKASGDFDADFNAGFREALGEVAEVLGACVGDFGHEVEN